MANAASPIPTGDRYIDTAGQVRLVPKSLSRIAQEHGWKPETAEDREEARLEKKKTPLSPYLASAVGAAQGLSMDLAVPAALKIAEAVSGPEARDRVASEVKDLQRMHPIRYTGSEMAAATLPMLIPGGQGGAAGTIARGASAIPRGLSKGALALEHGVSALGKGYEVAKTGEQVARAGAVPFIARAAGRAAAGGLEATAYGAGSNVTEAMLDRDSVSEALAAGIMPNLLLGAAGAQAGAALSAAGRGVAKGTTRVILGSKGIQTEGKTLTNIGGELAQAEAVRGFGGTYAQRVRNLTKGGFEAHPEIAKMWDLPSKGGKPHYEKGLGGIAMFHLEELDRPLRAALAAGERIEQDPNKFYQQLQRYVGKGQAFPKVSGDVWDQANKYHGHIGKMLGSLNSQADDAARAGGHLINLRPQDLALKMEGRMAQDGILGLSEHADSVGAIRDHYGDWLDDWYKSVKLPTGSIKAVPGRTLRDGTIVAQPIKESAYVVMKPSEFWKRSLDSGMSAHDTHKAFEMAFTGAEKRAPTLNDWWKQVQGLRDTAHRFYEAGQGLPNRVNADTRWLGRMAEEADSMHEAEIASLAGKLAPEHAGLKESLARYQHFENLYAANRVARDVTARTVGREQGQRMFGLGSMAFGFTGANVGADAAESVGIPRPIGYLGGFALGAGIGSYVKSRGDFAAYELLTKAQKMQVLQRMSAVLDASIRSKAKQFFDTQVPVAAVLAKEGKKRSEPESSLRDEFERKSGEVSRVIANPAYLTDQMGNHLGPLSQIAPQTQAAAVSRVHQNLQYLHDRLPRNQMSSLFPQLNSPLLSDSEMYQWLEQERTLKDPEGSVDRLIEGRMSTAAAEALRDNYPTIYGKVVDSLFQEAVGRTEPPDHQKLVHLSVLLGQPVTSTMQSDFRGLIQQSYEAQRQQASKPQSHGGQIKVAETVATKMESLEKPR